MKFKFILLIIILLGALVIGGSYFLSQNQKSLALLSFSAGSTDRYISQDDLAVDSTRFYNSETDVPIDRSMKEFVTNNTIIDVNDASFLLRVGDNVSLLNNDAGYLTSVDWDDLNSFPAGCPTGYAVQTIGNTLSCVLLATDVDLNGYVSWVDGNNTYLKKVDANTIFIKQVDGNSWYYKRTDFNYLNFLTSADVNLDGYWKNDGNSVATGNWSLGDYNLGLTALTSLKFFVASGTIYSVTSIYYFDFDDAIIPPIPEGSLGGLNYTVKFSSGEIFNLISSGVSSWNGKYYLETDGDVSSFSGTFEVFTNKPIVVEGELFVDKGIKANNILIGEKNFDATDDRFFIKYVGYGIYDIGAYGTNGGNVRIGNINPDTHASLGAMFQLFADNSNSYPGQVYVDSGSASGNGIYFRTNAGGSNGIFIDSTGLVNTYNGVNLGAGSTSKYPLRFNSGNLLSTSVSGAMEFLTDKFYGTISTGTARKEFTLNDVGLTSGRVPIVTTNGRLTNDSDFNFSIDTLTVTKEKVNLDLNVGRDLRVDGNVFLNIPYGSFYSMKTQTVGSTTVAYAMDFNTTVDNFMVQRYGDTNFGVGVAGDYEIILSVIGISMEDTKHLNIWLQNNGVNVVGSNTKMEIVKQNAETILAVNFIIDLNTTDRFRVMYASDSTTITLPYYPASSSPSIPSTPSSIMTIKKIGQGV
jgi:hypothetical protein